MPGPEFWQTIMGRRFIEGVVPGLIKQLERLNDNIEKNLKSPETHTKGCEHEALLCKIRDEILWPSPDEEWSPDTLEEIANVFTAAGFGVDPPDVEHPEDTDA